MRKAMTNDELGKELRRAIKEAKADQCPVVVMTGALVLTCWCHPLDCHARIIKERMERR